MISNSNPWDNLKFDISGIEEVKRKFLVPFITFIPFLVCMQILMDLLETRNQFLTQKDTSLIGGYFQSLTL